MGIDKIEIFNYKSMRKCFLDLKNINLFIGENGCGKTNILSAVKYFMDNLGSDREINECGNIFDICNPFNNCVKISVTFDLNKFGNIAQNQVATGDNKYQGYYRKIIKLSDNEKLKVTLMKIKGREIQWNISRDDSKILNSLFPVYFLDSRQIDLFDWSELWNSIGDLVKLDNDISLKVNETINKYLDESESSRFTTALSNIKKLIYNSNVQVKKYSPKQYSSALTKAYFHGEDFIYKAKNLTYNSNGTNAFNYTIFLIDILCLIANFKLKSPMILMDEPELSLHHSLIDQLSNKILDSKQNIKFAISTHSPRLVKNVLREDIKDGKIYNVKIFSNYSNTNTMKLFDDKESREKGFITDEHANAYFSKILLFVEGESDVALFDNKYIRDFYPVLNSVDIYKAISNEVVANIMHPKKRNYKTPYVILCDMDKYLTYNVNVGNFSLFKKRFQKNIQGFKFILSYKRNYLKHLYKRISGIVNKSQLRYDKKWGFCSDPYFLDLKSLIKEFLRYQSIFVNDTTIEGMIVNTQSYPYFKQYFLNEIDNLQKRTDFENTYSTFRNKNQECNYLRLICNGKADIILNTEALPLSETEKRQIESFRFKKTDGWMNKFIEYFFIEFLRKQGYECHSFAQYKSIMNKHPDLNTRIRKEFITNFEELNSLISLIESVTTDII